MGSTMYATYLLGLLLPTLVSCLPNRKKIIDLTHSVGEHTIAWPSATKFSASNVVRIDTPSTDKGQSRQFRTHRILGQANIWGLENMARTEELPSKGFMVYNMVHKLEGGSGGPTRVVAILDSAASKAGNVAPELGKMLVSLLMMKLSMAISL